MRRFLLLFVLLAATCTAYAAPQVIRCGDSDTVVINAQSVSKPFFTLSFSSPKSTKLYQLSAENEFLKVRCDKKASGAWVVLFLHTCGGTSCNEDSNFGIIDAVTGELLLEAGQSLNGNAAQAKKIMGKEVEPFTCMIEEHEGSNSKGEICFSSEIELG